MQRSIWISEDEWDSMKAQAEKEGRTISNYIRWLHRCHLSGGMFMGGGKADEARCVHHGGVVVNESGRLEEKSSGRKTPDESFSEGEVEEIADLKGVVTGDEKGPAVEDPEKVRSLLEENAKAAVVEKIRADLKEILGDKFKPYSKDQQLGKKK